MKLLTSLLLEDGQGLTEYALILGAIAIAAVAGLAATGNSLVSLYTGAQTEIEVNLK